jgi:hypothetical protein
LKSADRGVTWTEISPDLTRNDLEKQGRNGGPLTPENVGAEYYNTLFYIVESPHERGHIWAGSDDGLVHLSRDGGANWGNVSPPHKGEAMINAIEISPHDPATVYLAVTAYKLNDFQPYIYKTTDYGKRWKRIDAGLPEDAFVRVVREDPARKGQLYAGTETGMFVSFDDGGGWQALKLNLPPVPVTDLAIRHDALVAATQGRGFWTLDDLFMVRAAALGLGEDSPQLFAPAKTVEMRKRGWASEEFEASNPESGVPLYYYLEEGFEGPVSIDILDNRGEPVRSYSSEESDFERCLTHNMDPRSPYEPKYPPAKAGLNKWNWDTKRQGFTCVRDMTLFEGLEGPAVPPGEYIARLSAGEETREVSFTLVMDPRITSTPEEIRAWTARLDETSSLLKAALDSLGNLRKARKQIKTLMDLYPGDSGLQQTGQSALEAIDAWDHELIQPLHETYEDEDAWETRLAGQIRYLLGVIDSTGAPVTEGALLRLADLKAEWAALEQQLDGIRMNHIDPINEWARENSVPHVSSK